MAPSLQHRQTTLIAAISPTGAANFCAATIPSRWDNGYAVVSITLVQNIRQASGTAQNLGPIVESRGFSPEVAGLLLSLLHITQVGGTLLVGALSDRFATRAPLAALALLAGLGAALVGLGHNIVLLGAGVMLAGLGNAFWPLLGGGLAREFGAGAIGRAFGLAAFFVPVISLVPFMVARVKEATGAYTLAFIGLAVVSACVGLICMIFLKDKPLVRPVSTDAVA